ncbi:hypothetical protein [Streptomyces galilaeus]|uniref:hypothetical protein n=1 Tax=Streptomyces galilaeus TaxID=33899 RepID=UPI00167B22EE|nr:hypothetical protein [Streptomyces galilaeus]GGW81294.1 hypothetical protein GCM10010350_77620 [Streptomyces galilaeus]
MHPGFVRAPELLPTPKAADLPAERLAGTRCVWCGGAATDALSARVSVVKGELLRWEPSSCRRCLRREAKRVYNIHIGVCARCTHRDYCPDSRALYELGFPK